MQSRCDELGNGFPLLAVCHYRTVSAALTNAGGFGVLGAVGHSRQLRDAVGR